MPKESYMSLVDALADIERLKAAGGRWIGQNFQTKADLDAYEIPETASTGDWADVLVDEEQEGKHTRYALYSGDADLEWAYCYVVMDDPIGIASTTILGLVLGAAADADGKVFVESDGSMSVIGWDDLKNRVADLETTTAEDLAQLAEELEGKQDAIPDTAGYVKSTAIAGAVEVQEVPIPIADGGTGATTGEEALEALGGVSIDYLDNKLLGTVQRSADSAITVTSQAEIDAIPKYLNTGLTVTVDPDYVGGSIQISGFLSQGGTLNLELKNTNPCSLTISKNVVPVYASGNNTTNITTMMVDTSRYGKLGGYSATYRLITSGSVTATSSFLEETSAYVQFGGSVSLLYGSVMILSGTNVIFNGSCFSRYGSIISLSGSTTAAPTVGFGGFIVDQRTGNPAETFIRRPANSTPGRYSLVDTVSAAGVNAFSWAPTFPAPPVTGQYVLRSTDGVLDWYAVE
jgi:hypothetical protein